MSWRIEVKPTAEKQYLKLDKKFVNGKNRFVLAAKIGEVTIKENIPEKIITDVIKNRFTK